MRQGQQNRRNRGRGRNNNRSSNPLSRNYESNGPEVKIKGSAAHIAEKYMTLARDALSSGNTVTAENYYQHAEHYNRIIHAAQAKQEEHANAHPPKQQAPAKPARPNEGREKQTADGKEGQIKKSPNAAAAKNGERAIPGSGEQPPVNGNEASAAPAEEKPKRKPRARRPKAAKTEAEGTADGSDVPIGKGEQNNIVA